MDDELSPKKCSDQEYLVAAKNLMHNFPLFYHNPKTLTHAMLLFTLAVRLSST